VKFQWLYETRARSGLSGGHARPDAIAAVAGFIPHFIGS